MHIQFLEQYFAYIGTSKDDDDDFLCGARKHVGQALTTVPHPRTASIVIIKFKF